MDQKRITTNALTELHTIQGGSVTTQTHLDEILVDNLGCCWHGIFIKWLVTLTVVPLGLGSNPRKDMDVCKCIVPSRHGGTLNSRRAASPLVRLMEGEERWEAPDTPRAFAL
ncbi:uncharacterized protein TNCV_1240291 [Trichonephila clavipes]|uniref:Uncharacterized protein n=1 Tax=Trichonephila clavipes TaxID=2585209 RepID=A0A8X6WE12_TRICX|nr:uncharacterized protein TNCV_1240291 [Trichonephila clavipes]